MAEFKKHPYHLDERKFRKILREQNINIRRVCINANVESNTVYYSFQGRKIRHVTLYKLADALGVEPNDLLPDEVLKDE